MREGNSLKLEGDRYSWRYLKKGADKEVSGGGRGGEG
jgi:hypothetical protein